MRVLHVPFYFFIWNDLIEEHLWEHGITPDEFEEVVCDPDDVDFSHSSGRAGGVWRNIDRQIPCMRL